MSELSKMNTNDLLNYSYGKEKTSHSSIRRACVILTMAVVFMLMPLLPGINTHFTADAASVTASGRTTDLVYVRKTASTSSKSMGLLKKGTNVTISREVFTSKTSTSSTSRWYQISGGGKKGYIRADLIKVTKYANVSAMTTDDLNYRKGAGTSMSRVGTAGPGASVRVCLPAKAAGSNATWYRVYYRGRYCFMSGDYLAFTVAGKKGLAGKILAKATNGGSARYVGTLDTSNCSRVMCIKGDNGSYVPQGMAYTGSRYYIVFGMDNSKQRIVTYSTNGKRLSSSGFPFYIGHPNAMTWNPETKNCYIFKGSQKTIYTWNPATNRYGKATTPYSSSGVAYDKNTKKIYATSLSGVRVYSADGRFRHQKYFNRCYHSGKTYVQDCGAGKGYVIHALSSGNKFGLNYLDIYRVSDGKYLGSFKVYLGELESVIVDNKGYMQLLVNHGGTYNDWIWKTPINVNDLK